MTSILHIVKRKISKLGVSPIHVFVFHHVSDVRDPRLCAEQDWTQTGIFYNNLSVLQKKYIFISLQTAYQIIKEGRTFRKNYAVLTTDDGLRTVPFVLPWLEEHRIPLTCFVNAKYLDGHSYKECDRIRIEKEDPDADLNSIIKEQYMDYNLLFSLDSPMLSVASHGYEHLYSTSLSEIEFICDVKNCNSILSKHPRYIPFFAYPWGKHNPKTDTILNSLGLIPVLADGLVNYSDASFIHRECIDNIVLR